MAHVKQWYANFLTGCEYGEEVPGFSTTDLEKDCIETRAKFDKLSQDDKLDIENIQARLRNSTL